MDFTFIVISYNQEKLIIEHLETIKYQLLNYGSEVRAFLIISDDFSQDKTESIVRTWLSRNKLFYSVDLFFHKKNRGIVKNVQFALSHLKTNYFKLLAADDLYACNNIFENCRLNSMCLTPTFKLYDCNLSNSFVLDFYKEFLVHNKSSLKKFISGRIKYLMCIETPGVFWSFPNGIDSLIKALEPFKYIEDVSIWNYLLNMKEISVDFNITPYVIYRQGSGISTNPNHQFVSGFKEDIKLLHKLIYKRNKYGRKYRYLNPYFYYYKLHLIFVDHFYTKNIERFFNNFRNEEKKAQDYYLLIKKLSDNFFSEIANKSLK